MPTMTKQDVEKLIKDVAGEVLGEQINELRKELEGTADQRMAEWMKEQAKAKEEEKKTEKGIGAARFIRALAAAKGDIDRAVNIAKKWKDEKLVKALGESTLEDGAALVPEEYSQEIIELLRARAVVRSLGAMSIPMNSGSLTMPKQTGSGTAYYIGENQNITPSQQTFGQIQLSAKKLAALTPISNDLIRDASPNADMLVREDLLAVMSLREDLAFIRDDGTENKPKGMRYWADTNNVFPRTQDGGVNTLATVTADLAKAVRLIEEANVPMTRMGWIMTPRTKWYLMSLRDGNGNLVFEPEMRGGTLMTFPYKTTTQIPENLGAGSETEVYIADFSQLIIGENTELLIDVFPGGAYYDGTQVVSGISADQTVVRTLARHDFAARHSQGISVITSVDWM